MQRFHLEDATRTGMLGAGLAALACPGATFAVSGPLGAGKTCLARGLITALKPVTVEEIVSPTFTLVQAYDTAAGPVWHFDLYRLKESSEIIELGLEDALADICIIEWPERMGGYLPAARIDVELAHDGEKRLATITGRGPWGEIVNARPIQMVRAAR